MFKIPDVTALRREVANEMKARTSAFADKHYGIKEEGAKPRKSDKATQLDAFIATGAFGCNSASVAKALSIVIGEEVTYATPSSSEPRIDPFPFGVSIVPTPESGSSASGKALFNGDASDPKTFTDETGRQHGVSGRKRNSRPATAKEIDTLVSSIPDATLLRVAGSMITSEKKA